MNALDRAANDEAAGDLASARTRLASYLRTLAGKGVLTDPLPSQKPSVTAAAQAAYRPDLIQRLAELNLRMGDPAAAGQWFFLIDSTHPRAPDAIARFESSRGHNPFQIWTALPPWARNLPLDTYPPAARDRLARIMPPFMKPRRAGAERTRDTLATTAVSGCLILAVIAVVALIVIGAYTTVRWISR